jgi:hypothetical protein
MSLNRPSDNTGRDSVCKLLNGAASRTLLRYRVEQSKLPLLFIRSQRACDEGRRGQHGGRNRGGARYLAMKG